MILIRLMGGLGNQLFQLALGLRLVEEAKVRVKLDASGLLRPPDDNGTRRDYGLAPYAHGMSLAKTIDRWRYGWDVRPLIHIRERLDRHRPWHARERSHERHPFTFDRDILRLRRGLAIGYWQNPEYFSTPALHRQLRGVLTLNNSSMSVCLRDSITHSDPQRMVAVHVRRGDLVHNPKATLHHGVCDAAYFHRAMAIARKRLPDPRFLIFSDDPAWCRAQFPDHDAEVVSELGGNPHGDLEGMRRCPHHILSNSTLGWWAAWLGMTPDSLTIAPSPWLRSDPQASEALILSTWLRLSP